MKKIKVIIFDAYGTLFDVNSAAEKCKEKIGDKWESFANYWRTTQLEYTWLRSLMKRHKDFWQVTEDSLDKSLLAFKIDPNMRSELLNLYKILNTFPEVKEVLKNLKEKKYKISILSNGTPDLLDGLVKSNNLEKMFDDIFSVEEVGIYKPDAKVYDMPIKKYEVAKNEVDFLKIYKQLGPATLNPPDFKVPSGGTSAFQAWLPAKLNFPLALSANIFLST